MPLRNAGYQVDSFPQIFSDRSTSVSLHDLTLTSAAARFEMPPPQIGLSRTPATENLEPESTLRPMCEHIEICCRNSCVLAIHKGL
jgi:hypothetical protein